MEELSFIYKRKSIRKFTASPIPQDHIEALIHAATYAPSGTNSQNWHFVVLKNQDTIQAMAQAIEKTNYTFCDYTQDENQKKKFSGYLYYQTLFKDAPVVILLYASSYHVTAVDLLKQKPGTSDEIHKLLWHSPGIQNIGAAMENLLLSASALGYGTCWMTAPVFAEEAINQAIGFHKEGFRLACITPLGVPSEESNPQPQRKPLSEVLTIIE